MMRRSSAPVTFRLVLCLCLAMATQVVAGQFGIHSAAAQESARFYAGRINVPRKMRVDLQAAVDDLREYLGKITQTTFSVVTDDKVAGIILRRADDPQVPAEVAELLPPDGREACVVVPGKDACGSSGGPIRL
jgi:hypothetical protein